MANGRILLVEDDEDFGRSLAQILKHKGYLTQWSASAEQALAVLAEKSFDVIVTDMLMPGMNGLEFLRQFRSRFGTEVPVVMITGYGSVLEAVEAMKAGAFGYFLIPVNQDEICLTLEKAMELGRLKSENLRLRQEIRESKGDLFVGQSPKMLNLFNEAATLAASDVNILITGESGTGKEVLARFIHERSRRVQQPFVAINCQAYALSLIESELFGYKGGSFTGASSRGKSGKLESADGGTLFLDEIGDLDPSIQVKLLRVLETRQVEPVGGATPIRVDFRLVSATNQDLAERIQTKQFREDLYYRINTVKLQVPALRERSEDIPALAAHFIERFAKEQKKGEIRLSKSAERRLLEHDWPGNIREFKNAMEAAVALCKETVIERSDLRVEGQVRLETMWDQRFAVARQDFERSYFQTHLQLSDGNIAEMSRRTGVDRKQIYKKLYEYEIVQKNDTKSSSVSCIIE